MKKVWFFIAYPGDDARWQETKDNKALEIEPNNEPERS